MASDRLRTRYESSYPNAHFDLCHRDRKFYHDRWIHPGRGACGDVWLPDSALNYVDAYTLESLGRNLFSLWTTTDFNAAGLEDRFAQAQVLQRFKGRLGDVGGVLGAERFGEHILYAGRFDNG